MCWVGTEELQGALRAEWCRSVLTGLVAGGGEGSVCDEAEALGAPLMHVTALTL